MIKKGSSIKKSGLCLIWLFLLVGCVSNLFQQTATLIPTQLDFPAITKTSTATIAFTANGTVFPEQSPTPTQTYIERSITPSISLTPTRIGSLTTTPIPASTMSGPEIREFVVEMLQNNGECRLPCFWGLSPQLDTSQNSQAFIKRFGIVTFAKDIITHSNAADTTMGNTDISLYHKGSRTHISISYHTQLGKLEQLVVGAESTYESGEGGDLVIKTNYGDPIFTQLFKYYLMPDILSNYGKPTQILILPTLYDPPYSVNDHISLVLLYLEQGFFVEYIFPKKADGNHFSGCPNKTGYLYIVAWSLEKELSLPYLLEKKSGVGVNELSFPYYKSIEEATNLTNDEFYNMFTNLESTYCINTLESLWIQ